MRVCCVLIIPACHAASYRRVTVVEQLWQSSRAEGGSVDCFFSQILHHLHAKVWESVGVEKKLAVLGTHFPIWCCREGTE